MDRLVNARHTAAVNALGSTTEHIDIDMQLTDAAGADVTGLIAELQWLVGGAMRVSPDLLLEHPTVGLIAEHFNKLLFGGGSFESRSIITFLPSRSLTDSSPIGAFTMSCRFPGGGDSPE